MRLDQNPLFRKVIVPWYDSETACFVVVFFALFALLLGIAGIFVAMETPEYRRHLWVPVLLTVLSGGVIFSTVIRLIKRYLYRFYK